MSKRIIEFIVYKFKELVTLRAFRSPVLFANAGVVLFFAGVLVNNTSLIWLGFGLYIISEVWKEYIGGAWKHEIRQRQYGDSSEKRN